ncbi:hypothetical protein ACWEPC_28505 [Nonomuraea sp. NPDC004297]
MKRSDESLERLLDALDARLPYVRRSARSARLAERRWVGRAPAGPATTKGGEP